MAKKVKIIIEYDGTNYSGWQVQNNAKTVQGELEKAIEKLDKKRVKVIGAGRTDSGVHALGQVAHFHLESDIPEDRLAKAINSRLPLDIRIKNAAYINEDFHARFSAVARTYYYYIYQGEYLPPFKRNYYHLIQREIDWKKLKTLLKLFVGEHCFINFCSRDDPSREKVRTIYNIEVYQGSPDSMIIFKGNGFLRKQVRMMMGAALHIVFNDLPPSIIKQLLKPEDIEFAFPTAPPNGLYLANVDY